MSSRLAFSPLETPTVGMLTRAPRVHEQFVREPPITLAMPPPALPGAMFAPTPPPRPFAPSTCAVAAAAAASIPCSALPTTSATAIPNYYAPQPPQQPQPPAPAAARPPMTIKEESPPSSPEIPYPYVDATYSRSPLANSLPDLNVPNQRNRKTSRYFKNSQCFRFLLISVSFPLKKLILFSIDYGIKNFGVACTQVLLL